MTDISPLSREEKQLRKLLGQSIETEIPRSRIEFLLQEIIDGGGVGGGSYKIKDQYATLADLEAAHPTGADGDAYLVGDPTHIYVWLDDRQEYADGGLFAAVPGLDGNGIVSIEKTATAGLVDTYTVTYTDGTTDTFNVTNGAAGAPGADGEDGVGITDIQKTSTVGLVDTYTITLTDGSTYDFTVTNGSGGSGVPEGGTTGQVLTKKSNADGDVEWTTPSGGSAETSAIQSLSTENSEQASEIGSLSTETSEMVSELSSLSAAASEMASDIASTSTAQSEVDSTQNVALNSLSTENSAQTSEIGSLSQSMSEMASAASSTSTAQSEMDSTQNAGLASLSTENSTQASELTSLSTENSTQSSEIDSLSTAQSELGSEIDVIGSELDEKQGTLTEGPGINIDNDEISAETNIFTGTMAEWEQLSLAEKLEYTHAAIKSDSKSGIIDRVPTKDSLHAVSSGGVYDDTYILGHHNDASWIEVSKDTSTTGKTTRMFIQDNNLKPFTQLFDAAGQQEDVDSLLIDRDLNWKLVKEETGRTAIALPQNYHEILVVIGTSADSDNLTWIVPKADLTTSNKIYINGWNPGGSACYAYFVATTTSIQLSEYMNNGTSIKDTAHIKVYYR